MIPATPAPARLNLAARTRFALGDFAFNLYWQSLTLFLLYYYTDVIGLAVADAALVYMAGSIWDGLVDLAVGLLADRARVGRGGLRRFMLVGAVPLGLNFVLLYAPLPPGDGRLALILVAHLSFRTVYAVVNVPYSALTARVTDDSRDRASIAGLRMIFGTLAAVVVALGMQPIAARTGGGPDRPGGYVLAAVLFAAVGSAILIPVALGIREHPSFSGERRRQRLLAAARALAANRAFVTLVLAMVLSVLGVTILNKLILYYFKYNLGHEAAGRAALAKMSVAGGIAIPVWMTIGRRLGGRLVWLASTVLGLAAVGGFAIMPAAGAGATEALLIAVQIGTIGTTYAFWALLPDTIEFGERATGIRIEATTFGVAALAQKIAIGGAAGLFGIVFDEIGYRANVTQSAGTLAGMRAMLIVAPAAGFALSAAVILLNPLRRGTHAQIVAELRGSARAS